nr:hypothetical protein Q903MT_gene1356 [Picea sitchensis]
MNKRHPHPCMRRCKTDYRRKMRLSHEGFRTSNCSSYCKARKENVPWKIQACKKNEHIYSIRMKNLSRFIVSILG